MKSIDLFSSIWIGSLNLYPSLAAILFSSHKRSTTFFEGRAMTAHVRRRQIHGLVLSGNDHVNIIDATIDCGGYCCPRATARKGATHSYARMYLFLPNHPSLP